jgi:hypothetical protein
MLVMDLSGVIGLDAQETSFPIWLKAIGSGYFDQVF